jgi:hypothetical protein
VTQNVLVVHGVANRDEAKFEAMVKDLATRIDARATGTRYNLVPAYWGDLGGGMGTNLRDALPPSLLTEAFGVRSDADRDTLLEEIYRARRVVQTYAVRSDDDAARVIAEAARAQAVGGAGGFQTRGGAVDDAELRQAIDDALRGSAYVKRVRDPDTLRAIGEVVGASIGSVGAGGFETRGLVSGLRDVVGRVIGALDNLLGSLTSEAVGALNQAVRGALATATALSLGDIVAYRDTGNGAAIRQRVIERARKGGIDAAQPIIVLAHSLGGLVVLDMLQKGDLQAKRLVTFGSQPAMFHVLKQLPSLAPYAPGSSTRVSPNIASWTNLWHPMDVLGFVASPVFALADGSAPTDIQIDTPLSTIVGDKFWMHSAYWDNDALVDAVVR